MRQRSRRLWRSDVAEAPLHGPARADPLMATVLRPAAALAKSHAGAGPSGCTANSHCFCSAALDARPPQFGRRAGRIEHARTFLGGPWCAGAAGTLPGSRGAVARDQGGSREPRQQRPPPVAAFGSTADVGARAGGRRAVPVTPPAACGDCQCRGTQHGHRHKQRGRRHWRRGHWWRKHWRRK